MAYQIRSMILWVNMPKEDKILIRLADHRNVCLPGILNRIFHLEGTCNDCLIQLHDHLSRYLLNTERSGATTSLGNVFQCLTILLVKNCFLMSSLNVSWHCCEPFLHTLFTGYQREEVSTSTSTSLPQETVDSNKVAS